MTVPFSQWREEVLPFVPSCPEIECDWAVRSAAIEFCDRSWVIRSQMDPVTPVVGQGTYDLDAPTYTDVCGVTMAYFGGTRLQPRTPEQLSALYAGGDWKEVTGQPKFYHRDEDDPDTLRVVPMPDAQAVASGDTLKITVAIKPQRSTDRCSDWLWRDWMEEIAAGAKAKLMSTPAKDYTDPQSAMLYRTQFVTACSKAKIAMQRGQVNATLVARPPDLRTR